MWGWGVHKRGKEGNASPQDLQPWHFGGGAGAGTAAGGEARAAETGFDTRMEAAPSFSGGEAVAEPDVAALLDDVIVSSLLSSPFLFPTQLLDCAGRGAPPPAVSSAAAAASATSAVPYAPGTLSEAGSATVVWADCNPLSPFPPPPKLPPPSSIFCWGSDSAANAAAAATEADERCTGSALMAGGNGDGDTDDLRWEGSAREVELPGCEDGEVVVPVS